MDRPTEKVGTQASWTMPFADDIVICDMIRKEAEQSLECRRHVLEKKGRGRRSKTEYLGTNGKNNSKKQRNCMGRWWQGRKALNILVQQYKNGGLRVRYGG